MFKKERFSRMDTFPLCSLCQEQFTLKGPAPYLLPCLHAVCETCVTSAAGGVISCSICQRQVNLTDTSLQKDAVREKEIFHLTVKHRPTVLLCTHEDDGNQAVCWCQDCEEFLCEYCQNTHNSFKATKKHGVHTLAEIEPSKMDGHPFCSIHKYYPLDRFDQDCKILICDRCRREDHVYHDVEDVTVVADASKQQIEHHEQAMSLLQISQQSQIERIGKDIEVTEGTCNTLKKTIRQTFHSLRAQLDEKEKECIGDVAGRTKQIKNNLQDLQSRFNDNQTRGSGASEYIKKTLKYASKIDMLTLDKVLGEETQNCIDSVPPNYETPILALNMEKLDDLKAKISSIDSISKLGSASEDGEVRGQAIPYDAKRNKDKREIACLQSDVQQAPKCTGIMETAVSDTAPVTYHLLETTALDKAPIILQCIHLKYDSGAFNLDYVNVNTEGELVNRRPDTRLSRQGRLKTYCGTCSTAPLPRTGYPQYWEMIARLRLNSTLRGTRSVLETGLCRRDVLDRIELVGGQNHSYSLTVSQCPTHGGICRNLWKKRKHVLHLPVTLANMEQFNTLHYGVVYDDARKKIAFVDVKENKLMVALDNVDSSQPLWPMFGVYNKDDVIVSMSLVVGHDINMTQEKKLMITQALQAQQPHTP
ncbi:tripartite motif-containing protein 45-like [Haliotis rufescens]|uniref:tripartite motif-containing protein 45-like n=1 Tax=Haliotis rufescens TaxID=6454 RepID=UPI00201F4A24|nr:tripartite motif-containing protein 45-like [Haliotis rufescens]